MRKRVSSSLRPCLNLSLRPISRPFSAAHLQASTPDPAPRNPTHDYKKRVSKLAEHRPIVDCYPRLPSAYARPEEIRDFAKFEHNWKGLKPSETHAGDRYTLSGRVVSVRSAGSKLVFLDLARDGQTLQALCNLNTISEKSQTDADITKPFKSFAKIVRKGDWYSVDGLAHRSPHGELSILATEVPTLLSPSLHQVPDVLEDAETRARQRHVDMLVNKEAVQTLLVRSEVERALNTFLAQDGFVKVQTPLLTAGAGGAVARPFETEATELQGERLNLRIAPELWLKRLLVGGMDRVYEVGPAFRNEGVDATHNPEFAICEFYAAFANLEWLMEKTESLLQYIMTQITTLEATGRLSVLNLPNKDLFSQTSFQRLDFIPTLERELGQQLPSLNPNTNPDCSNQLLAIFEQKAIPLPARPTLPRLLDALSSHYLEPLCIFPTFITNHPAVLSPLSKHFVHPTSSSSTDHLVAARAELFINSIEYANMYEEENSPFEQRRKFEQQLEFQRKDGEGDGREGVDENYLSTLEWGLPPTGGWGCGVDRLVMLMSGRQRISDVLAFGSLRNVVGLGQ
ncbi:class II aaRS and biotin synthetase [Polychaeton citri CBS 116435]|uniref:Lysyl-tRNA synthetase n=1 Tax=Polychaeton citri CBS 116435 TaxID=1314669 RepID=A0A9P4UNP6_9PEZI|nr:class II aaRS and biotin synthetase [Polychaeton citri CBS 116435]